MIITGRFMRDRIRRKTNGYVKLAEALGYVPNTIYNWMNGRNRPCLTDIWAMADLLEIDPNDLVEYFLYLEEKRRGRFRWSRYRERRREDMECRHRE